MDEKKGEQVGFLFTMPMGETLQIRRSEKVEYEIAADEEVDGIIYNVYWNEEILPWCTKTYSEALVMTFSVQYGANQMFKKICHVEKNEKNVHET